MKTVEQVRRERLLELKREFGSYAKLNELLQRTSTDSTLSQIANMAPDSKTGTPRVMGSPQARLLEERCGKPVGWMDTDPDLLKPQSEELMVKLASFEGQLVGLFRQLNDADLQHDFLVALNNKVNAMRDSTPSPAQPFRAPTPKPLGLDISLPRTQPPPAPAKSKKRG